MRSTQMTKRSYMDGSHGKYAPVYYLMHNIPEEWDNGEFNECYSIVAHYANGSISQWFYSKDELDRAFRVFRIMAINRHM